MLYHIVGFFEGINFHEFHKSIIAIRANFTLKMFTESILSVSSIALFCIMVYFWRVVPD